MSTRAVGPKRPPGYGSLLIRTARDGTETWYGKYREDAAAGRKQVKRRLGVRRSRNGRHEISQAEAEARLARLMGQQAPRPGDRNALHNAYSDLRKSLKHLDAALAFVTGDTRMGVRDGMEAMYAAEDAIARAMRGAPR